jgi:AcrR family transcriptional regulator
MRHPPEGGTRERILEVAEASLGEYGYHGTRLHEIASRVGIQKASLFHYFPSKEHLYRTVLEEGFGQTEETICQVLASPADPIDKVRSLVSTYVDMVAAHPQRTKILLRQTLGDAPAGHEAGDSERLLRLVAAFISDAQQAMEVAPIDALAMVLAVIGLVAFFFTSARVLMPTWHGDPRNPSDVERVKRYVLDIVERCLTGHGTSRDALPRLATPAAVAEPQGRRASR